MSKYFRLYKKYWCKKAVGVETTSFTNKVDLACLKPDVDKLDIDGFRTVPNDLNNLESKIKKINIDKLKKKSIWL